VISKPNVSFLIPLTFLYTRVVSAVYACSWAIFARQLAPYKFQGASYRFIALL
jgi:hypothetical protein